MAELKLDEAGHVVVQDGKPVYVIEGKDTPFDYVTTVSTITRLNGEARDHRVAKEEALGRLKAFEGIEDAESARKALDTVSKLSSKELIDAGKVDEIKAEAQRAFDDKLKAIEAQYRPHIKERDQLRTQLDEVIIGSAFSRSKFISDEIAVPVPMLEATFGRYFSREGNTLVAKDSSGNQIYSRARPGELATFDEALETLVDASPFRDSIRKGSGASGSGATGSGGRPGSKALPRAQFVAMDAAAQMAHVKAGGTVSD